MKKIIVPVDFSTFSDNALAAALLLADKAGASISLVHVVPTDWEWHELSEQDMQKHSQLFAQGQDAEEKLENICKEAGYGNIDKKIVYGYPYEQITQFASQTKADLIVIGSYGKEYRSDYYIGSTIQKVVRTAPCPVLAVKNKPSLLQFRKLVFASDFEAHTRTVFEKVIMVARLFDAAIHLVYINTPSNFVSTPKAHTMMNSFLTGVEKVPVHTHIYDFNRVDDGLESFTNGLGECCLVVATTERKLKSLYLVGITETLIHRITNPVLSIKMD